jgi:hypothetical protein
VAAQQFAAPKKISSPVIGREGDVFSFLAFKILKKGHTITGAYYASLLTKLRENIKLKCKGMLSNGVLLQHDNASSHTCVAATSKAAELAFQILP